MAVKRLDSVASMMVFGLIMIFGTSSGEIHKPGKPLAPALIVFGDSTVDPGNNNNLSTILKSNFPPYGKDFVGGKPTGRFCNGKLPTDFIAEGLGIKDIIPAYLDPTLTDQDLVTGVSFASAGTGYDNRTSNPFSVIPLWKEVEYFKEYRMRLGNIVGVQNATRIINEAIFVVSMGSNDFLENYYVNPLRRLQYNVSEYQDLLLRISANFLEEIYNLGARRIAVAGLPPLGCLPLERTLRMFNRVKGCVEELNEDASGFNKKLNKTLKMLTPNLPGLKMTYSDIYTQLIDMLNDPPKYGFVSTRRACCGTGLLELGYICNSRTPFTCSDASKYVFWDAFHPTQKVYQIVAEDLLAKTIPHLL
eukprot:Gb_35590 [translate_table: standard]